MKTAIITGANGFVGSAVMRELLQHDYQLYALDREGCNNNIPNDPRVKFFPCELSDLSALIKKIPSLESALFFHFAWAGSAGSARADTALQLQNAQWTVDALRVAKQLGCSRFLCAGSIMEHETIAAAYTQGNRPGLAYIYGGGKVIAHIMCVSVAADIGIELVWPEITNAYGVGEHSPRMINTTIQKCLRGEAPQFTAGTQNYDFIYIDDVARAFRLIGEKGKPFHEYLIGSSSARPLKEFLLEMQAAVAPELPFHFGNIPFTGTNLPLSRFDCSNTEHDTGFRAEISFAEGCRRTMEWWKSQEACKK
ncbi:NAD(P)-dependent oxidoreductase [Hydrogenoanaerobacterium sp.]|uniref:NAD-dependent epimerase/dehydratase family protein n=1 Tax=Hydrogenoanaerobacterium sp. TaxID=2953763 RepID=UPI0028A0B08C|nr:NAD(P)-dependent oxidoreductase [Hydrogenoanaerobacterium sp.]